MCNIIVVPFIAEEEHAEKHGATKPSIDFKLDYQNVVVAVRVRPFNDRYIITY